MAILISDVVGKGGCPGNHIAVDLDREPRVDPPPPGIECDIERQQIIAGFLDDDIFFTITLVAVGGVVDDVDAVPVTDQGEGSLVRRVHVLARGCFGEAVTEKAVIAQFIYKNRCGPVCLDLDATGLGQLLGGYCQDLSGLGPDHP